VLLARLMIRLKAESFIICYGTGVASVKLSFASHDYSIVEEAQLLMA
jgi:hypothetical protein